MNSHRFRVCVVGTGYVGVATAIGLAHLGHDVVGYDILPDRVRALSRGIPPYHEEGITPALRRQLETGRLQFTDSLERALRAADFVVICVGTPSRPDGAADLSSLESALEAIAAFPLDDATLVLRSTLPCGTTDAVVAAFAGRAPVLYAPEFLREGHALEDFLNPDRIVVGCRQPEDALAYVALFAALEKTVVVTSYRDAELIKAFSNAFLALKISFANEVAAFCERADADALMVLAGVGADRRIGAQFLKPGIGFGGPCFSKDLSSIEHQAAALDVPSVLVSATLKVNEEQPKRIVALLEDELGTLRDRKIAVWGLTFKAGTDDVRDSLAVRIVEDLRRRGAHVSAHDPAIRGFHPLVACEVVASPLEALKGADGLLVLTEWPAFAAIDAAEIAARLEGTVVVDGRNVLDGAALTAHGLTYRGVGRRPRSTDADRVADDAMAAV